MQRDARTQVGKELRSSYLKDMARSVSFTSFFWGVWETLHFCQIAAFRDPRVYGSWSDPQRPRRLDT